MKAFRGIAYALLAQLICVAFGAFFGAIAYLIDWSVY